MKLSIRALAITSGLVWGGAMLTSGLVNLAYPSYGGRFLKLMSSIYPGFRNKRSFGDVLVGAGYGLLDGAAAGLIVAALYNRITERSESSRLAEANVRPALEGTPVAY